MGEDRNVGRKEERWRELGHRGKKGGKERRREGFGRKNEV